MKKSCDGSQRTLAILNVADAASQVLMFPLGRDADQAYAAAMERIAMHAQRRGGSIDAMVTRYFAERFLGQVIAFLVAVALLGGALALSSRNELLAIVLAAALPASALGLRYVVFRARGKGCLP